MLPHKYRHTAAAVAAAATAAAAARLPSLSQHYSAAAVMFS